MNWAHGTRLMRSERWAADRSNSRVAVRGIPFILDTGHISGMITSYWRCSSYQWFATTVRSVIDRLEERSVVHKRSRYKTWRHLTMTAVLYVITQDDGVLERLLHCKREAFVRLHRYYLERVGEQNRFLYDQALSGALWFELRGNPRVQPTKKTILAKYRNLSVRSFDASRDKRLAADQIADPWICNLNNRTLKCGFPYACI